MINVRSSKSLTFYPKIFSPENTRFGQPIPTCPGETVGVAGEEKGQK
jgi:hypothetical protein